MFTMFLLAVSQDYIPALSVNVLRCYLAQLCLASLRAKSFKTQFCRNE